MSRSTPRASVVAAFLVTCLVAVLVPATTSAAAPEPVRIMLVGDSLTEGSHGDFTWRYRLWQHLVGSGVAADLVGPRHGLHPEENTFYVDPDFDTDHAAKWGATLGFPTYPPDQLAATYRPDVVFVLLGLNDLSFLGSTPSEVLDRLRQFVAQIRLGAPRADVVVSEVPNAYYDRVRELNTLIAGLPAELSTSDSRVVVADADAGFAYRDDTWDDVHPNARGEMKIAAAAEDALAALGVGVPAVRPLPDVPLGPRLAPELTGEALDGAVSLAWTGSPGATAEIVWWRDVDAGGDWQATPPAAGASTTVEGLVNGHRYEFELQPVKGLWPAEPDIRSNVLELAPAAPPPAAAGGLAASADRSGRVLLSWQRAELATHYVVGYRNVTRDGSWRRLRTDAPVVGTTAHVDGLRAMERYAFRVRSWNTSTAGGVAGPVAARIPRPGPVRDVHGRSPRRGIAVVTGSAVAGAASYRADVVRRSRCGAEPAGRAFTREVSGLDRPRVRLHSRSAALWVRLRAIRNGVPGQLGTTATTCVVVR